MLVSTGKFPMPVSCTLTALMMTIHSVLTTVILLCYKTFFPHKIFKSPPATANENLKSVRKKALARKDSR